MKKRIIALASIFIILIIIMTVVFRMNERSAVVGEKSITVEVIHSDEELAEFSYTTEYEYLSDLLLEEGLIEGTESSYGLFVTTVDGEVADYAVDNAWWSIYVGQELSDVGVSQIVIEDGSVYNFTYTKG